MQEKIIDVHMHFNMDAEKPIEDFIEYISANEVAGGVLIINTKEEMELFLRNFSELRNKISTLKFAFTLHKYDDFLEQAHSFIKETEKELFIKLHPRLSEIKEKEIVWYVQEIAKWNPDVIIIDDFLYGDLAGDLGLQLVCLLAGKFPDKKIVMAHAGGVNLLSHVMQSKTYKNVYYDISLTCNYLADSSIWQDLKWLLKFHSSRVMAGSDYPCFSMYQVIKVLEKIKKEAELNELQWENLLFRNAQSVYGGFSE